MRFRLLAALTLLLAGLSAHGADAPRVTLTLLDTDPATPAVLHRNGMVYVRLGYDTSAPVTLWMMPYYQGRPAPAAMNGLTRFSAGQGEKLGWFDMGRPGEVDELRVFATFDGETEPSVVQKFPLSFSWDGEPYAERKLPDWVVEMRADEGRQIEAERQVEMGKGLPMGGWIVMGIFGVFLLAALLACFGWPLYGLIRWRGAWRVLAGLPLLAVVAWALKDAVDIHADPSSHNLLPFEYLEAAVLVTPYMLVVWLLQRKALRTRAES